MFGLLRRFVIGWLLIRLFRRLTGKSAPLRPAPDPYLGLDALAHHSVMERGRAAALCVLALALSGCFMVHGEGDDDFGNAPWIGNRTDGIVDVFRVDEAGDEDRIARIQARGSFSTDQACDEEIRLVARNLRGDVIATRDEPVCSQQVWMIGE